MRAMLLRRTPEGHPDYYYCTECAWIHTEAEFLREGDSTVAYHHEIAELGFKKHQCKDYSRPQEGEQRWL